MAAATYRIGPSDTFTGGDLEADAQTLDGLVEGLDAQIEGSTAFPSTFVDQWVAWQGQWKTFFTSNFGGFFTDFLTALNDSNRDQLIQFETRFNDFSTQAKGYGADTVAPVLPSTGSGDTLGAALKTQLSGASSLLPSATTLVVVAVAIVLVLVVWKA